MRYIIYSLLFWGSPLLAQEQPSFLVKKIWESIGLPRNEFSENAIQQLQNKGVLVVRLPSKAKKIAAIDAEIIQFASDARYVKRLQKMRTETINNLQKFNLRVSTALSAYYNFSDIYFVYDTSIVQLINGKKSNLFMDALLYPNPKLTVEDKFFLILKCEKLGNNSTSTADAFVVTDSKNEQLDFPFPAVIPFNLIFRRGERSKIDLSNPQQQTFWASNSASQGSDLATLGKVPSKTKMKKAVDGLNNSFKKYAKYVESKKNER